MANDNDDTKKRSRIEDSDDLNTLESLVEGDTFATMEEQNAQSAESRRNARRQRLKKASKNDSDENLPNQSKEKVLIANRTVSNTGNSQGLDPDAVPKGGAEGKQEEEQDEFDMFATAASPQTPTSNNAPESKSKPVSKQVGLDMKGVDQQQEWDDVDGYYKATPGEIIDLDLPKMGNNLQFRVMGVIGKGVFSTVLKCTTASNNSPVTLPPQVALKFVRHNDTMAKAAQNEIRFLQDLKACQGIIPLLLPTGNVPVEFRGHTVLVFPHVEYNLRDVLTKFGKNVGLSLSAVRSYFSQLLSAGLHLKQHRIVHSDLKPDNILVSQDFATVQMCDFGSAVSADDSNDMVTPYLVSRFYRAPEIILGLNPTYAIDLWSIAVSMVELFLGRVLFQGKSNNDMIKRFMEGLGPVSNRVIRQHLVQVRRHPLPEHFVQEAANFLFLEETVDAVTGVNVHKHISLQKFTSTLKTTILKAKSSNDSRTQVLQFADLLQHSLALDPSRRMTVKDALNHEFFKEN